MATYTVYTNSDNLIQILDTTNVAVSPTVPLTSATVRVMTIEDSTGTEVTGADFPIAASFIAGSNGDYYANLPDTIPWVVGATYEATVEVDGGEHLKRTFKMSLAAKDS